MDRAGMSFEESSKAEGSAKDDLTICASVEPAWSPNRSIEYFPVVESEFHQLEAR